MRIAGPISWPCERERVDLSVKIDGVLRTVPEAKVLSGTIVGYHYIR